MVIGWRNFYFFYHYLIIWNKGEAKKNFRNRWLIFYLGIGILGFAFNSKRIMKRKTELTRKISQAARF